MASEIVVLIATRERPELLCRTLSSLGECRLPEGYRETIVIENGTRAGAEAVVAAAPSHLRARYLFEPRGNKSAALNVGLERVSDDALVFFTDDDVRLHPGVLEAYAAASAGTAGGVYYGGPVEPDYEERPPDYLMHFLPPSARGWPPPGELPSTHRFVGFNWAAFARDIRALGGFDPRFEAGSSAKSTGDESQMQDRLLASGVRHRFVPEARVWHYVPKTRCSVDWALRRAYRNGVAEGIMGYDRDARPITAHLFLRLAKWSLFLAASSLSLDPRFRVEARYWVREILGEMAGRVQAFSLARSSARGKDGGLP